MTIKVVLIDDHSMVREGMRGFIEIDPELEVVGEGRSGTQALELAQRLQPDVVLMDLLMPGMDGITATRLLKQQLPQIKILAITGSLDTTLVGEAIQAGVSGCLLKILEPEDLCQAIKAVVRGVGGIIISPQFGNLLVDNPAVTVPIISQPQTQPTIEQFTSREYDILQLLALGKSNKEISQSLKLNETTVKLHVSIILAKLGAQSRTQAALYAAQAGLLSKVSSEEPTAG